MQDASEAVARLASVAINWTTDFILFSNGLFLRLILTLAR